MQWQDALFHWLQMEIVSKHRPEDRAAKDTSDFFLQILKEDHGVEPKEYQRDNGAYTLEYEKDGKTESRRFDAELAEQLLVQINSDPKYSQ